MSPIMANVNDTTTKFRSTASPRAVYARSHGRQRPGWRVRMRLIDIRQHRVEKPTALLDDPARGARPGNGTRKSAAGMVFPRAFDRLPPPRFDKSAGPGSGSAREAGPVASHAATWPVRPVW